MKNQTQNPKNLAPSNKKLDNLDQKNGSASSTTSLPPNTSQIPSNQLLNSFKPKKWWQKKSNQIIITLLLLASIITLLWFFWPKNEQKIQQNNDSITVIKEKGQVSFKIKDDQSYSNIVGEELLIPSGSSVKTGLDSLAHILMPDNSLISLDKDTELKVEVSSSGNKFNQLIGSTWHRVEKVSSGKYEVETSTALATVRGTIFGIELSEKPEDLTGVYLIESKLDVTSKIDQKTTELMPGSFIEIGSSENSGIVPKGNLSPALEQGRWYKRNKVIDALWKRNLNLKDILNFKNNKEITQNDENSLPTLKENCLNLLEEKNRDGAIGATLDIQSESTGKTLPNKSSVSAKAITFNPCRKGPFPSETINWKLNNQDKPLGDNILLENLEAGEYTLGVQAKDGNYSVSGNISFKIELPVLVKVNPTVPKTIVNIVPNIPIFVQNQAPVANISSPVTGKEFSASYPFANNAVGNPFAVVTFNGNGTDQEDGSLPGNNLVWKINGLEVGKGNTLTKNLSTSGVCGSLTDYFIELVAQDSKGLLSIPATIKIKVTFGQVC